MKAGGKYRFNLQFPAETEEQIQAGELLERAGNKKSAIVVDALREYLQNHSELLELGSKIKIQTTLCYDKFEIEQLIRKTVAEFLHRESETVGTMTLEDDMDDEIAQMLDNLELFQ